MVSLQGKRQIGFAVAALLMAPLLLRGMEVLWKNSEIELNPISKKQGTIAVISSGKPFPINVEIRTTPEGWAMGLMHRPHVPQGNGMLFVFDEDRTMAFWMKNTIVPLDILFFDRQGRLITMHTNAHPCEHDPCPTYSSEAPARFVLEVAGGTASNEQWTTPITVCERESSRHFDLPACPKNKY